jgi:hypothetical protein
MQKTVFRFGLYGVAFMTVILLGSFLIFKDNENWEAQEILGYTTIIISLLFVYFGIRHWRDNYNNGNLSFGQGLKLGTLITLFPSAAFGLFTWLEMSVLDPEFSNKYYSHYLEKIKASTPPEKLHAALQKLESEKEMFANPFIQFFFMFLTVFLIGIVITVVSSLILQRNERKNKVVIA